MDENQMAGQTPATSTQTAEHHEAEPRARRSGTVNPQAAATAQAATTPATAAATQAAGQPSTKKPTPNRLVGQVGALQQAETIKQLQGQVKQLEAQSKDTGKIFLATTTTLITSAFALVAALAWNEAIQDLFKKLYPPPAANSSAGALQAAADLVPPWQLVISAFAYAVVVTIIVVAIIFYLTKLNTRLGGKSLLSSGSKEG